MNAIIKELLICLIAAHFIGDFLFQTDKIAEKKNNIYILLKHSLIVSILSYVLCGAWTIWQIFITVFITHTVVDFIKARFMKKNASWFIIDQAIHIFVLVILAFVVTSRYSFSVYWIKFIGYNFLKAIIIISGAIVCIKAGSILIGLAVEPFLKEIRQNHQRDKSVKRLKNAGIVIGQLERGLIFIFVLFGLPEGIGFLLAAKSIFRFGEIKKMEYIMESEYIFIGTMMSFAYGIIIAYATKFFYNLI